MTQTEGVQKRRSDRCTGIRKDEGTGDVDKIVCRTDGEKADTHNTGRRKAGPVFAIKVYWEMELTTPLLLNLGTSWR